MSREQRLQRLEARFLHPGEDVLQQRGRFIVTLNMQHLYEAWRDPELRAVLFGNDRAVYTLDGRGAAILLWRQLGLDRPVLPGNEMVQRLLEDPTPRRFLVIGGREGTLARVKAAHSQHDLTVCHEAFRITSAAEAEAVATALAARFPGGFDAILLALGVPKQERLAGDLAALMSAPVLCIGGSFEILTREFPRAPRWMRHIGLEGLWRLIQEPNPMRLVRLIRSYGYFLLFLSRHRLLSGMFDS
jgi:N-acetylglucosaminyldiphosphoundecaprenol N-acetyl-beta-D-mannosaminyltransferase